MTYRVFVSEGPPHDFPDFAPMVIDGPDYVFVVGDDELARIPVDDVRDVESLSEDTSPESVRIPHAAA